jgi:hypothetical protein
MIKLLSVTTKKHKAGFYYICISGKRTPNESGSKKTIQAQAKAIRTLARKHKALLMKRDKLSKTQATKKANALSLKRYGHKKSFSW